MSDVKPFQSHETLVLARHLHMSDHAEEHGGKKRTITPAKIRDRYVGRADFVGVEEHGGYINAQAAKAQSPLIVPGNEAWVAAHVGTRRAVAHHAGFLGVDAKEARQYGIKSGQPLGVAIRDKIHQADGVLIYNHPEFPDLARMSYTLPASEAEGVDAVEAFNDVGITKNGNDSLAVMRWVERNFYARGLFPAIVGGQDEHANTVLTKRPSLTYALAAPGERDEHALMGAIRSGATYVSQIGACDFAFDIDGEHSLGARPALAERGLHEMRVRLSDVPEGARVQLLKNGEAIAEKTVGADGDGSLSASFRSDKDGYVEVRVIVERDGEDRLALQSSALAYTVR